MNSMGFQWVFVDLDIFPYPHISTESQESVHQLYHSFRFINNMDDTTPSTRPIFVCRFPPKRRFGQLELPVVLMET